MFEQFKQFVDASARPDRSKPNKFWPVPESDILDAERRIGARFPETLRQFYQEVGYGFFRQGVENNKADRFLINRVVDPRSVADILANPASVQRPPEGFPGGGIPFFDVGDYTYLVIQAMADSPDGVFWPDGKRLVSQSIGDFFASLYQDAAFFRLKLQ